MLRQTQHERIWGIHELTPHPETPPSSVVAVGAQVLSADRGSIMVEYSVRSRTTLLLPQERPPARIDGLWRTTCFEAFLRPKTSERYLEMNFSPSFEWAAYEFDGYREGMTPIAPRQDPEITISDPANVSEYFFLSAEFDVGHHLTGPSWLALSAVIEETDGTKSYWALRHPPGAPDFHHPDCFALELPALASP